MSNRSPETNILVKYLEDCHVRRHMATYVDMAKLLHTDVAGFRRNYSNNLTSALKFVFDVRKMVFQVEPRVGYTPIKQSDVPQLALDEADIKLARLNQKLKARLETVDPERLPDDAKVTYQVAATKGAVQTAIASSGFNEKLEQEIKKGLPPDHETGRFGLNVSRKALFDLFNY